MGRGCPLIERKRGAGSIGSTGWCGAFRHPERVSQSLHHLLLPLHQSPMDFLYIEDREKGGSIDGVNDLLQ